MTKTIREVLDEQHIGVDAAVIDGVEAALRDREQEVLMNLVTIGAPFGVTPQIAAKIFADNDLGVERSDEEKALITESFDELLNTFREQMRMHGHPAPEQIAFPPTTVTETEVPDAPTE